MNSMFKKVSAKNRLTNKHIEEEEFNKANNGVDNVPQKKPILFKPEILECENLLAKLYLIGDLVWTKVRKSKAWPAMITFDPDSGTFFKEKFNGKSGTKCIVSYHVQYFGNDALHGWVSKNLLLKYEGKDQVLPKFFAKSSSFNNKLAYDSWCNSIIQADEALQLNVNDRKLKYIHNYFEMPNEKTKIKKKSLPLQEAPVKTKIQVKEKNLNKEDLILKEIQNPIVMQADITRFDDSTEFLEKKMLKSIQKSMKAQKKLAEITKENAIKPSKENKKINVEMKHSVNNKKINSTKNDSLDFKTSHVAVNSKKKKETKAITCKAKDSSKKSTKTESKEFICKICEEVSDNLLQCTGECLNYFHADCLGLPVTPTNDFKCDECLANFHTCFSCKQPGHLLKCSHSMCGKFYHTKCLENLPFTKFLVKSCEKFHCPLHQCNLCYDASSTSNSNAKVIQCVRCPTAYHPKTCLAAGSTQLTSSFMICDNHFSPRKSKSHHSRVNVTWCFVCSRGGSLICCDNCPASFHVDCLSESENKPKEGETTWKCQDCQNKAKLKYHDIVWVKYSAFRWWPAQIYLPSEVPEKIQNLPHDVGEFPVFFFGTHDYIWLPPYRCFKYQEGDTGGCKGRKSLAYYFSQALNEAKVELERLKKEHAEEVEMNGKKKQNKPPPFGHIRVNRPVTCIRNILHPSEWPVCTCTPEKPCNGDSDCLNQLLYFECNPKTCPAKENCQNQRMQKCNYAKCKPFKCEGRGWGLVSDQDIKSGDFVIEYVGELIDEETCYKRIQKYHQNDVSDYYFLTIDRDNIIDAYPKGNLSRFMNHSCDPNCVTQKWTVNGEMRVGLFAVKDIRKGEELCFNYNLDCLGNEKKQCKCGSENCSGFLGVRPTKSQSTTSSNSSKTKKKKKKKNNKVVHDDDCFICTDGGELILCGRPNCPKSYHMNCLNLEHAPRGRWDCPYHFCDVCGRLSHEFCTICPNSFCKLHTENEFRWYENMLICVEHTDDDVRNYIEDSDLMKKATLEVKSQQRQSKKNSPAKVKSPKHENKVNHSIKSPEKDLKQKKSQKLATTRKIAVTSSKVSKAKMSYKSKKSIQKPIDYSNSKPIQLIKNVKCVETRKNSENSLKSDKKYNFSKLKITNESSIKNTSHKKLPILKISKRKVDECMTRRSLGTRGKRKREHDQESTEKSQKRQRRNSSLI